MNGHIQEPKVRLRLPHSAEILLWLIIPVALLLRLTYMYEYDAIKYFVRDYYWDMIIATLFTIFPIFFRQIFSSYPLEFLMKAKAFSHESVINVGRDYIAPAREESRFDDARVKNPHLSSGTEALFGQAERSRKLAKDIYGRSGVYLLLGVLVAFSGLVFFYTQTTTLNEPGALSEKLLLLAPKFGILFFIEFVAFFFLRQYRSAMDEFRYYESIARRREEVSALLILSAESEPKINLMELVKSDSYFSKVSALEKDQSTEILEARKLEKGELELLGKVVESVVKAKG
ncbi:hypothetical protein RIN61_08280 [Pseudomonas inefficax]|jgi:hypothetical protein|uniref:hypothetical protein n=1 Tax=Pseudomonas putida group TaxID=136845 RepID=UPI00067D13D0|nr:MULTISPECIES: hypothetical protein [Pseudomonas putida group]MBH3414227.1 hypothetical protein [Pseudomonas putida]MBS5845406.1 hypothetical protein [Pseudomonas putida]ORL65152.1 hypothetical protein B7H19_23255 [Pseudomonas putida]ULL03481.1 hypothetical protein JNO42_18195 [Pseudomonas putida]WNN41284.1 hypothetical protein RIN61_08280 [Pseudomonas inefficax]